MGHIYTIALYYTVTTITTVGYGDITGTNTFERIICIIIMIVGVFFFSYTSGTLTNMISNQEAHNKTLNDKIIVLNKIYEQYKLPADLYYQTKGTIEHNSNSTQDCLVFINELPCSLRHKINLHIYKSVYQSIHFLKEMDINFITWLCPMLKS